MTCWEDKFWYVRNLTLINSLVNCFPSRQEYTEQSSKDTVERGKPREEHVPGPRIESDLIYKHFPSVHEQRIRTNIKKKSLFSVLGKTAYTILKRSAISALFHHNIFLSSFDRYFGFLIKLHSCF